MATTTIQVADKPTLDEVNGKCDDIYEAVISGGGGFDLSKVHVYIGDFRHDTVTVTNGGLSSAGYITT